MGQWTRCPIILLLLILSLFELGGGRIAGGFLDQFTASGDTVIRELELGRGTSARPSDLPPSLPIFNRDHSIKNTFCEVKTGYQNVNS